MMEQRRSVYTSECSGRQRWQCRFCNHSLEYWPEDRDAARLAIVSHLRRCHRMGLWLVLAVEPDTKRAAEEYFGRAVCRARRLNP